MNIREERENLGLSQQELSEKTGIPKDRIAKWEQRNSLPKAADFAILQKFFNDNRPLNEVRESESSYLPFLEKRRNQKNGSNPYLVPFVDIPAQAGYTKAYSNIDYIATLKQYPILPDVDPTGAEWRYFQVDGDSMEDEIRKGDTILASLVLKEDWPDIKDYYTYVVVTNDELLIKDVFKEDPGHWILLSQNRSYKPRRIDVAEIMQLWVLRRHVRNRVNKTTLYDMKEIKNQLK